MFVPFPHHLKAFPLYTAVRMKVFASLLLVVLAAIVAVEANVQPTPAPRVEKRQSCE